MTEGLSAMPEEYLLEVRKNGQTVNPLFGFLGVEILEISADQAVLRLPFRPEFVQGAGVVAGGVLAALADEAMAHVVLANLANLPQGRKTATIEMSVRYFRPVHEGGVTARARLVNAGRRILSVEATVSDDRERQVCKAEGSFFIIEKQGAQAPDKPLP